MRLPCPICGDRDRREFYYLGAADYLDRPAPGQQNAYHSYLHLRATPAGETRELWYHEAGCGAWILVTRDTVTHEVSAATCVEEGQG